jgi:hypothetical protein
MYANQAQNNNHRAFYINLCLLERPSGTSGWQYVIGIQA